MKLKDCGFHGVLVAEIGVPSCPLHDVALSIQEAHERLFRGRTSCSHAERATQTDADFG